MSEVENIISMSLKWLLFAIVFFTLSCAEVAQPPGGPEDTTPPFVEFISPGPGETNVPAGAGISVVFSEYMDRQSVEDALSIQPMSRDYKLHWKGRTLIIDFKEDIPENSTTLLSIDSSARDAHRVEMGTIFSSGFSTGSEMASGRATGIVLDRSGFCKDAVVFLYRDEGGVDDIASKGNQSRFTAPCRTWMDSEPVRIVHTSDDGSFLFDYLEEGYYSCLAFRDRDRNETWNEDSEDYGISPTIIHVTETDSSGSEPVEIFLADVDTKAPWVSKVKVLSPFMIDVEFSEEVMFSGKNRKGLVLVRNSSRDDEESDESPEPETKRIVPGNQVFRPFLNGSKGKKLLFFSNEPLSVGESYTVLNEGFTDEAWNLPDSTAMKVVFRVTKPDSATFQEPVALVPSKLSVGDTLMLRFCMPFRNRPDAPLVTVVQTDSSESSLKGRLWWMDDFTIAFRPVKGWRGGTVVPEVRVFGKSIDSKGPSVAVTEGNDEPLWKMRLIVVDERKVGRLVVDASALPVCTEGEGVPIFFEISSGGRSSVSRRLLPETKSNNSECTIFFDGLKPGSYIVDWFVDEDGNGVWTPPCVNQAVARGETRGRYPDTVEVTAGREISVSLR